VKGNRHVLMAFDDSFIEKMVSMGIVPNTGTITFFRSNKTGYRVFKATRRNIRRLCNVLGDCSPELYNGCLMFEWHA
jgi:hypothetical protein